MGVDRGAQRLDEVVLGELRDGGQQPVLDGGTALGDEAGDPLGALGQGFDADQEQVAQGVGEAGATALVGGDGEFLDEEGVAVGTLEDRVDLPRVGFVGEDPGDLAAHLVAGEAAEFEAADGAQPVEFGEQGAQRMAAVDVVGAVGGEDDEAAGAQGAEEVGDQVAGGGVGPVQVLQDEDDGVPGGDALQQAGGQLEEPGHALLVVPAAAGDGGALGQFGQQPGQFLLLPCGGRGQLFGQVAAQGAQRGGERCEGQSVGTDLDAAAQRHDGAPPMRCGGELLDEAGLADAGLAAEQQGLRLSPGGGRPGGGTARGAGERVVQRVQFAGAADEHGTDGPGLHGPEHRTRVRQRVTGFRQTDGAVHDGGEEGRAASLPVSPVHAARANRGRRCRGVWLSASAAPCRALRRAARRARSTSRASRASSARRISSAERYCWTSYANMACPSVPLRFRLRSLAMPQPSSPRGVGHIGKVPHLRRRAGPQTRVRGLRRA